MKVEAMAGMHVFKRFDVMGGRGNILGSHAK
jgi:hypothetical protein